MIVWRPRSARIVPGDRLRGGWLVEAVEQVTLQAGDVEPLRWIEQHDRRWRKTQVDYLLEHDVDEREAEEAVDVLATLRFEERWLGTEVQRVEAVRVGRERFLAVTGSGSDYRSGSDELGAGAVPDADDLHRRWSDGASGRHQAARVASIEQARAHRGLFSIEQRIVAAQRAARAAFLDVRDEARIVRKYLAEGRGERSIAVALERLERHAYRERAA